MTLFLTINGTDHIDLSLRKDPRKTIRHALQGLDGTQTYSVALWKATSKVTRYADAEEYLQSAGDASGMTLEVRCRDLSGHRLFAVGRRPAPSGQPGYVIKWDQFEVAAFASEVWSHQQALPVYLAYLATQELPDGLHLRDRQRGNNAVNVDDEPELEAMAFAWLGLDQAVAMLTASEGEALPPFAIQEYENGTRHLARFGADNYAYAVSMGRRQIGLDKDPLRALLAFDGLQSVDGTPMDAIIVEFYTRGDDHGYVLSQRYRPVGMDGEALEMLGGPEILGRCTPLF